MYTRFLRSRTPIITKTTIRSRHSLVLANQHPTTNVEKSYPEMKAAFFSAEKKSRWMNTREDITEFIPYLDQLFNDLIIPHFIRQIERPDSEIVRKRFIDLMLEDLSFDALKTLYTNWKINHDEIENKKQGNFTNHAWEPLFHDLSLGEYQFKVLYSEQTLKEHIRKLDMAGIISCKAISGYVQLCFANKANVVEIIDAEEHRSTLELAVQDSKVTAMSHRGYKYLRPVKKEHIEAAQQLITNINKGVIPLNEKRLSQEPMDLSHLDYETYYLRYSGDAKDSVTTSLIYRAYEGYLPPKLTAQNYEMMVHYAELNELYKSEEEFYTNLKSYKIW